MTPSKRLNAIFDAEYDEMVRRQMEWDAIPDKPVAYVPPKIMVVGTVSIPADELIAYCREIVLRFPHRTPSIKDFPPPASRPIPFCKWLLP